MRLFFAKFQTKLKGVFCEHRGFERNFVGKQHMTSVSRQIPGGGEVPLSHLRAHMSGEFRLDKDIAQPKINYRRKDVTSIIFSKRATICS